jgi:hypothetical protein
MFEKKEKRRTIGTCCRNIGTYWLLEDNGRQTETNIFHIKSI